MQLRVGAFALQVKDPGLIIAVVKERTKKGGREGRGPGGGRSISTERFPRPACNLNLNTRKIRQDETLCQQSS